jgi:hypothetical protein
MVFLSPGDRIGKSADPGLLHPVPHDSWINHLAASHASPSAHPQTAALFHVNEVINDHESPAALTMHLKPS